MRNGYRKILKTFNNNPNKWYTLSEMTKASGMTLSIVRRHINDLVDDGFLKERPRKLMTRFEYCIR